MENKVENLLDKLSENLKEIATTKTVVGEEFTIGEFTCKPVMKVGVAFGTGSGTEDDSKKNSKGSGAAAGGGVGMQPIGFLVTRDKEISFLPADQKKGMQAIFDKVPDLLAKVMDMKEAKIKKGKD